MGVVQSGEFVGELGVILGRPRPLSLRAGTEGMRAPVIDASAFKSLPRNGRIAARGILALVSGRLASTLEAGAPP